MGHELLFELFKDCSGFTDISEYRSGKGSKITAEHVPMFKEYLGLIAHMAGHMMNCDLVVRLAENTPNGPALMLGCKTKYRLWAVCLNLAALEFLVFDSPFMPLMLLQRDIHAKDKASMEELLEKKFNVKMPTIAEVPVIDKEVVVEALSRALQNAADDILVRTKQDRKMEEEYATGFDCWGNKDKPPEA